MKKINFKKIDWFIILGLLLLSAVPMIGGIIRLNHLLNQTTGEENARFLTNPISISLHIIAVTIYSLLGAFQFSGGFRKAYINLHRQFGKILIVSGLISSLTGIWMTLYYPTANFDGVTVFVVRLIVGIAMTGFLFMGIESIRKKKFEQHGQWMIRAYALGLGAGTQVFTHIPWFLFPEIQGEVARGVAMTSGWLINALISEWVIRNMGENRKKFALAV